jgi:hypothetical protein
MLEQKLVENVEKAIKTHKNVAKHIAKCKHMVKL